MLSDRYLHSYNINFAYTFTYDIVPIQFASVAASQSRLLVEKCSFSFQSVAPS